MDGYVPVLPRHTSGTSSRTDTSCSGTRPRSRRALDRAWLIMLDDVVRYVLDEVAMDGSIGEFDVPEYVT